jgi:polyphosphate kinase
MSFIDIFTGNLDEFFMVRVGSLYYQMLVSPNKKENKTGMTAKEQLSQIFKVTKSLLKKKDKIYFSLMEKIKKQGVELIHFKDIKSEDAEYLKKYFRNAIMPLLSPQVIGKKQPFPFLNNKDIYAVALIERKNREKLCIVPCSNGLFERLIPIPSDSRKYILAEEMILHFMPEIFDNYTVKSKSLIRVIRNSDVDVDDDFLNEEIDYRESMEKLIKLRRKLCPVKMESSRALDEKMIKSLCRELGLKKEQIFYSESPLEMSFVYNLQDILRNKKELFYHRQVPKIPPDVDEKESILEQIAKKDILLSYPYESMNTYLRLLKEAVYDERVVSIKMTLYRVAKNSQVVETLIDAAEHGKEVVVMVELRARFDEKNNIEWSRRMEDAGCRIIYGIEHMKVHSKICLISYREENKIKHISQIGTGNYNEKTSKIYTDFSLMTAREEIAQEIAEVFNQICMGLVMEKTEHLLVAPKCFQDKITDMIEQEIQTVKNGGKGYIGLKLNSLTDKKIMNKLIEASQAGVKIDMIIRGICCLIAGVEGYTENITIQSIVGRYLEHSRIYIFGTPDRDKIYISSADFMTRNSLRRVEVAAPIYQEDIRKRLRHMFQIMMEDNVKARVMDKNGIYHKKELTNPPQNSQEYFFKESAGSK